MIREGEGLVDEPLLLNLIGGERGQDGAKSKVGNEGGKMRKKVLLDEVKGGLYFL